MFRGWLLPGCVLVFAALAVAVETGSALVRLDRELNEWLHAHATAGLTRAFELITTAGGLVVLFPLVAVAVLVLLVLDAPRQAALVALAFAGSQLLTALLKAVFQRPRPPLHELTFHGWSFPSGHALGATAVYGALALVAASRTDSQRVRQATTIGLALLVALIAASRVYLGAHYLSDVLAGICAGAAWLLLCELALRPRSPSRAAPPAPARSSPARRDRDRAGSPAPS